MAEEEFTPPKTAQEMGLMQGFPPPADKRISNRNFMQAPQNRWSFQHIRELQPTREIFRGTAPASQFESEPLDLDALEFKTSDDRRITFSRWLQESHTDSIVVLHQGKIVYERYLNGMTPHTQHQMFSVTKSFIGTMVLVLADQGRIDLARTAGSYLPELAGSAFEDATVQHLLDMTTAVKFSEDYLDRDSDIWRYGYVFSLWGDPPEGYRGPMSLYDYLPTLRKQGEHGHAFHYVTPNTDVLGWIASRIAKQSVSAALESMLFQPLGPERDAYIWLDGSATEMAGGGLNITARDAARFGQMILQNGFFNGKRIIPAAVAKRILRPGDPAPFNRFYRDPWYEQVAFAYHDQWWTFNNAHKAVSALGIHGQQIYLDATAQMVVVKQSSDPAPESDINETESPLAYQALAEHLMNR
ncbi:MAG: serine hydrolase [Deltaproteobacteria bacterium]|nr:serine hydrolase [Deltaproteobacteria bacterium]